MAYVGMAAWLPSLSAFKLSKTGTRNQEMAPDGLNLRTRFALPTSTKCDGWRGQTQTWGMGQ
eukprot:6803923-Lingulodinium_polyedra.AAC.1